MVKTGFGFDVLKQSLKPKTTTFMDYEPGHVGDENYRKTNTKTIYTTNSNKTNTTNKTGNTKSTATVTKEPKREAFSWSDDDFLEGWNSVYNDTPKMESSAEKLRKTHERLQNTGSGQASRAFGGSYKWATTPISSLTGKDTRTASVGRGTAPADQDRLFFEGLFDVDGATGDYEREKRNEQVENALRDLENRKPGDMLRRSMGNTIQPTKYSEEANQLPRAEFHAKSDIPIPNTHLHKKGVAYNDDGEQYGVSQNNMSGPAYQYADDLINGIYNSSRFLGIDNIGLTPAEVSELDRAKELLRVAENKNKAESVGKGLLEECIDLYLEGRIKGESLMSKSPSTIMKEYVEDLPKNIILDKVLNVPSVGNTVTNLLPNFTENDVKYANEYLKEIEESDQKYLINGYFERKSFISRLEKEAEEIKNTKKFGFLPQKESDEFKEKILMRLNKIIQMNKNYQYEAKLLDDKWNKIKGR